MTAREFLSHLDHVRPVNGGWQARCPAHEDKNPSLSVSEHDGKILLRCHAGCETSAIVAALGLTMADLFADSGAEKGNTRANTTRATIEGLARIKKLPVDFLRDEMGLRDTPSGIEIPYSLADGSPAPQQRIRGFLEHVKDPPWCWWSGAGEVCPYGLDRLDATRDLYIILVEGESDCCTLWYHGFLALGIPGVDMTKVLQPEHLAGIPKVFIIQESDPPGVNFVRNMLARLKEIGYAGEVRIVSLAPCKDANELHCADPAKFQTSFQAELDGAIDGAQWTAPAKAGPAGFTLTRLGDLMAEPQEQVSWLLEGILPAGGLGLLAAKPKCGKSTLARCLALAVARGEPFLGRETQKGGVIFLALEEKRSEVRAHFRAMGATGQEQIFIHVAAAPLDALLSITVEVKRHKPVLLVIDPALRFVRVKDSNDYAQISAALEPLLALARENGCHTLLIHHLGKSERAEATDGILGSTAMLAAVDTALILKRCERYRTLQSRQRYGDDLEEITLEFDPTSRTIASGLRRADAEAASASRDILAFLRTTASPKTEPEINESVKGETTFVRHALRQLVKEGALVREGAGKRGDPYRYSVGGDGKKTPGPAPEISLFNPVVKPPSEEAKPEPSSDKEVI